MFGFKKCSSEVRLYKQNKQELLNKELIMLPVDKTGQPDWAYMEEYMRKVDRKTEGMLNQFVST